MASELPRSGNRRIKPTGKNDVGYLKTLIKTKDEQIEKLVAKISDLHNYNNQFAKENNRLKSELKSLNENSQCLNKQLDEIKSAECPACIEWEQEKNNLSRTNKLLRDDVFMMKTLVYRLNVQLERYQDKLRKTIFEEEFEEFEIHAPRSHSNSPNVSEDQDGKFNWGSVNNHTLGPLLNAYEEMIKEKGDLILQQEKEINRFTGHFKEIIEENEQLHKEMDELKKGQENWKEDRTRLQAQLEICRNKADVQTKRADLAKEKLVEVLRCYEQKVQAQALDLERLQDSYSRTKTELASLKNAQTQPTSIIEGLKECQHLFDELKSQHGNEKTKLITELGECRKHATDLEEKLSKFLNENSILKISNEKQTALCEEWRKKYISLKQHSRQIKDSRDRLKARLRIALQWAQKLEESRNKYSNTWDQLKDLEALVQNKEAQIRGLQARHIEEVNKLQRRLEQREETIKAILKEKAKAT